MANAIHAYQTSIGAAHAAGALRDPGGQEGAMGKIIDKAKGRVKQAAGDFNDDPAMYREGVADEVKGDLKGAAHSAKRAVKGVG